MAAKKAAAKSKAAKAKPAAKPAKAAKPAAKATKAVAKAPAKKAGSALSAPLSKTQILAEISERTELSKKQVSGVFDELTSLIERHVTKKSNAGVFTLPGLLKISVVEKPATKSREGVNPFTGEKITIKAKPARRTIKVRPLKKLKDFAA